MWLRPQRRFLFALFLFTAALPAERQIAARVPMHDGVHLSTSIFLPEGKGPFSTLLVRTPYSKENPLIGSYRNLTKQRYAIVLQDVRGRYSSEGTFDPVIQETADGDDTLNWIASQGWSDGKIGMLGGSYIGITQWRAALSHNPHLIAIFPVVAGSDEYRDRFYSLGGALKLGHRLQWIAENMPLPWPFRPRFDEYVGHLPLRSADRAAAGHPVDFWQQALNHPTYDDYWRARSTREHLSEIRTPAFIVGGWYDNYVQSDLDAFAFLSKRSAAHRIVIGPWPHSMSAPYPSGITFGPTAGAPVRAYQMEWYDYWMRAPQPAPEFSSPRVHIFVMGVDRWRDEQEWPIKRTHNVPMYLDSDRGANTLKGDGQLSEKPGREDNDSFAYDPHYPVPTAGGAVCCNPKLIPWGPMDQRPVEGRSDVLVYTSAPLKKDLEVTGAVRVVLTVSTDVPDTDFTAKLVDIYPDGFARNLCDGILRLRYRDGVDKVRFTTPGEMYQITIDAGVTSNVFRAGHRIRLDVSSSNFPRFDRNPNTGKPVADEKDLRVAHQTVYHGRAHPSRIVLPVIP